MSEFKTVGLGAMFFATLHNLVQWAYGLPSVINPAFCHYWYNATIVRWEMSQSIPLELWAVGLTWFLTFLFILGMMAIIWLFIGVRAALILGVLFGIFGGLFLSRLFQIGPPSELIYYLTALSIRCRRFPSPS